MSDDKTYGFKLGNDNLPEAEEPPLNNLMPSSETPPSVYDRLRRRITLVAVLIPLLLAAMVVVGYLDIKRRVDKTENVGTTEVLNLSRDLESSFSSLSVKQAKLEASMAALIAEIQKKSDSLQTGLKSNLQETGAEIESLKKSLARIEKKQLSRTNRLEKELQSLQEEMRGVGEKIKTVNRHTASRVSTIEASIKQIRGQLTDLSEAMRLSAVSIMDAKRRALDVEESFRKVRKELQQQLAAKLDRKSLSRELTAEQQRYEKKITLLTARLIERITTIEKKMTQLASYLTRLPKSPQPAVITPKKLQEQDIKE